MLNQITYILAALEGTRCESATVSEVLFHLIPSRMAMRVTLAITFPLIQNALEDVYLTVAKADGMSNSDRRLRDYTYCASVQNPYTGTH